MKKLTSKEFIDRCVNSHGDKYDYSHTKYNNIRTKVKVCCKKHGEFEILPENHINRQGCATCAKEIRKMTKISEEKLEIFKKIHNNYYEYKDLSVDNGYINIICPIHGEFKQNIFNHERGHKCSLCAGSGFKLDKISDLRLSEFNKIHNNYYEYKDLSVDNGYINIICPMHGKFRQNIHLHESGSGCLKCALDKRSSNLKKKNLLNPKNPIINNEKKCLVCTEFKAIDLFPLRDKNNIHSHRNQCDDCFYLKQKNARKIYRQTHKKELREYDKKYRKHKIETDPLFRAKVIARNVIRKALTKSGYTKKSKTYEILGCSYEYFRDYLESLFVDGISWDNREKWHIDHIIPLSFAKNEEECLKLNNYRNLRPIWSEDNLEKSAYITEETDLYNDLINSR